jgi:hypothetical protein
MFMAESKPANAKRRRLIPGQGRLLAASVLIILGALLPWLQTGFSTPRHPQYLWLFVVGFVALSGALVPLRRVAFWHAVVTAVVSLALLGWYLWQLVGLAAEVGMSGWMVGPGLVLTAAGGGLSIVAARTLASVVAVPAASS